MTFLFGMTALLLAHFAQGYPYPPYSAKRYARTAYQPTYIPVPLPYGFSQDNLDDYSFPSYRYYYYPVRTDPRYGFYDDPSNEGENNLNNEEYPFGQETWYENGEENSAARAAANAEADAAFLRNLIITQMYQDAAASAAVDAGNPSRYAYPYMSKPTADYDDKNWLYGVPTTDVEEKERLRESPKVDQDEEVKELESLRKTPAKEGKRRRKQKAKENREKKSDFGMMYTTEKPVSSEEPTTNDRKSKSQGQKEEVLAPGSLSFGFHHRPDQRSAYQTIKELLALDSELRKTEESRVQKRFVSSEEQLTQQLSSLKKSTF